MVCLTLVISFKVPKYGYSQTILIYSNIKLEILHTQDDSFEHKVIRDRIKKGNKTTKIE